MALDGLWVDGVQQKFRPEDILDGDISAYTEPLVDAVETWMDENIEPGAAAVIDKTLTIDGAAADAKVVGDELTDVKRDLILQMDEIPDTIQSYTFDDGTVSQITHSRSGVTIRTDVFTYGTDTITEVRTSSAGTLTIVTNLTTLETTVTYVAA